MSTPVELEHLLRADDWLRRLARRLVGDPEAAADLAQDAWVAALEHRRADRPWLFGVLRNLRRASARRAARESDLARVARESEAPPTDEVVEVVDDLLLRKRVTEGLLELEEPFRTVLYLRFVQDLGLAAIARRTGVAVSTVHHRLARGLELLRRHLDERYDGRRRTWALGLLGLAKPKGVALSIGSLIMGTSTKLAGAVLLLGGAVLWLWPSGEPAKASGVAPAAPHGAQAPAAGAQLSSTNARESALAPSEPGTAEAVTPVDPPELLLGRIVDLGGQPVAAVRVGFESLESVQDETVSDGRGNFALPVRDPAVKEHALACLEPDFVTLIHGLPQNERRLIVVGHRVDFAGIVTDPVGEPIPSAAVRFDLRQSLFREHGVIRPWNQPERERRTRTDEDGRFELAGVCGGDGVGLWVGAEGFLGRSVEVPAFGDSQLSIVLEPAAGERVLEGYVIDSRGQPVPEASVSAGTEIVRTDADGAFRLAWKLEGSESFEKDAENVWRPMHDTSVLRAAKAGYQAAEAAIAELRPGESIVLRLGDTPLSIRGRLVDEHGAPRAGAIAWIVRLSPFGTEERASGDAKAIWERHLEEVSGGASASGVITDADGRFELRGLLPKEYEVRVVDPQTATQGGPWQLEAGAPEQELVLTAELATARVAGRIVTARGQPLAGVTIVPRRSLSHNDGTQPPSLEGAQMGVESDEDGRFEFPALATSGTVLELQHESFFIRQYALAGRSDLAHLEIVEPVLCELQVELQDPLFADALVVLDDEGRELQVLESWGAFLSMAENASFEAGRTGVLRVLETARTLVLRKDDLEVLRRPLQLEPGQRAELRL